MKITREQFTTLGAFHVDDFPIDSSNQDVMFELFNHLPANISGLAIQWGLNDTEFRDFTFRYLCRTQFDMTCEEYYESLAFQQYSDEGIKIEIDFNKFK